MISGLIAFGYIFITVFVLFCAKMAALFIAMFSAMATFVGGMITSYKKKHGQVTLGQRVKALWNVKPIMFRTDEYPPKL